MTNKSNLYTVEEDKSTNSLTSNVTNNVEDGVMVKASTATKKNRNKGISITRNNGNPYIVGEDNLPRKNIEEGQRDNSSSANKNIEHSAVTSLHNILTDRIVPHFLSYSGLIDNNSIMQKSGEEKDQHL